MHIIILNTAQEVADFAADTIMKQVNKKKDSVLGLATGATPIKLYEKLVKAHQNDRVRFNKITSFNLDEYIGLNSEDTASYRYFMEKHLFSKIDVKPANTHVPDGAATDPEGAAQIYEQTIEASGGIDLQILGIGRNGHIGFNEPPSAPTTRTRVVQLSPSTLQDNAAFFESHQVQPLSAITMGVATILDSRKILLLATGAQKSEAIRNSIEGVISDQCPASALQRHANTTVVLDKEAAQLLTHSRQAAAAS